MTKQTGRKNIPNPLTPTSPFKAFAIYLIGGFLFCGLMVIAPPVLSATGTEEPKHWDFPYLELDWLFAAATISAAVAVAITVLDLPGTVPSSTNRLLSLGARNSGDFDRQEHDEKQLTVGMIALYGVGMLSAICVPLSVLSIAHRDPDRLVDISLVPQGVIAATFHLVIVGVCSMGLGYKNETFLKNQNLRRISARYSDDNWENAWGLSLITLQSRFPSTKNFVIRVAGALLTYFFGICFVLAVGLPFLNPVLPITERFNFKFGILYELPEPGSALGVISIYSFISVLGFCLSTELLISHEVARRMAEASEKHHSSGSKMHLIGALYVSSGFGLYQALVIVMAGAFRALDDARVWLGLLIAVFQIVVAPILCTIRLRRIKFGLPEHKLSWLQPIYQRLQHEAIHNRRRVDERLKAWKPLQGESQRKRDSNGLTADLKQALRCWQR